VKWRDFFSDPNLVSLIDTALKNNQELNVTLQELAIAKKRYLIAKRGIETKRRITSRWRCGKKSEDIPAKVRVTPAQTSRLAKKCPIRWVI
jgi:hypothetical protein